MAFDQFAETSVAPRPPIEAQHLGALVLGVQDRHDPHAMHDAYQTIIGEELTPEMLAYSPPGATSAPENATDEQRDRFFTLKTLRQIFENGGMEQHNVLRSWPVYAQLYAGRVQETETSRSRAALLVGAGHPFSRRAFAVQASELYGAERAIVIDPRDTNDTVPHGTFVRGDGTCMPFADESLGLIQTNFLFNFLGERGYIGKIATKEARALQVMREAFRTLQPGGHLLMCELGIGRNFEEQRTPQYKQRRMRVLRAMLAEHLPDIGFDNVIIEQAFVPANVDHLFNAAQPTTVATVGAIGVYAHKPHRILETNQ